MAKEAIPTADLGGTRLSADELAAIPALSGIKKDIWDKFPGAITSKEFKRGEVVFRQGENGTTAFLILEGSVEILLSKAGPAPVKKSTASGGVLQNLTNLAGYLKGTPKRKKAAEPARTHIPVGSVDLPMDNPVATLEAGEMFGELSALAALKQDRIKKPKFYPRSATIRATTDIRVLEMLPNILNNVLYNNPAFKGKLDAGYKKRALDTHLRSVPVFSGVPAEFLAGLRDKAELVDFPPDTVIFKQGDPADAFYLIRLGFVKIAQDFPGGELVLAYLSRGSYFGEVGLLPLGFTVRARGKERGQIADAVVFDAPVTAGREVKEGLALQVPWDLAVSRTHLTMAVEGDGLRVSRRPEAKNPILMDGKAAGSFLVRAGQSFTVGDTTFEVREDAFLRAKRNSTVTAMDFVQAVRIKREEFQELIERHPEVRASIFEVARARRQSDVEAVNRVQTVSLESFLDQELMQGQNLLLMDLDRCTRCDECVKACVTTHSDGVTRLIREGVRFDKYLVPTACRACLDPLCMTQCPVSSIRRKGSLDIVIEDWCIGCNKCADTCPYGSINIVPLEKMSPGVVAAKDGKAVVCDLCAEYPEPNCVRACPHGAAIRVEPRTFFAKDLAGVQLAVPTPEKRQEPTQVKTAAVGSGPTSQTAATNVYSNLASLIGMLPTVELRNGERAGTALNLLQRTSFGRGADNTYKMVEEGISRNHCEITVQTGRWAVRDAGSTNGTFVNGIRVQGEAELRDGDVITLGELEMAFRKGGPVQ